VLVNQTLAPLILLRITKQSKQASRKETLRPHLLSLLFVFCVEAVTGCIPPASFATTMNVPGSAWSQATVVLKARSRGCHLVTDEIMKQISDDLKEFKIGLANFFLQHTSASLTINENWYALFSLLLEFYSQI